jgi:protein-tyrosine phosphatase
MSDKPFPESYWVLPDRFLAGAYPILRFDEARSRERVAALLNGGLDIFIDLTNLDERISYDFILEEQAARFGTSVRHLHFHFSDYRAPSPSRMIAVLDAIDSALAEGHKVYLHCVGGIGRTGTTVGCWLVRHGMEPAAALQRLRELYKTSAQSEYAPRSPESDDQLELILNWAERGPA